jgi:hypothetical protein
VIRDGRLDPATRTGEVYCVDPLLKRPLTGRLRRGQLVPQEQNAISDRLAIPDEDWVAQPPNGTIG